MSTNTPSVAPAPTTATLRCGSCGAAHEVIVRSDASYRVRHTCGFLPAFIVSDEPADDRGAEA